MIQIQEQTLIRAKFRIHPFLLFIDASFPRISATVLIIRARPVPVREPIAITIRISKAVTSHVFLSRGPDVAVYFRL